MGIFGKNVSVQGGEKFNIGSSSVIEIHYGPIETLGTIVFHLKPENILFSGDYFGQITPNWKPFIDGSVDEAVKKLSNCMKVWDMTLLIQKSILGYSLKKI